MPERTVTLTARSALPAGGRVLAETLHIAVLPARAVLLLRLGARSLKHAGEIRVAGRPLPLGAGSWSGDDPVFCRFAPDAWMVLSALHAADDLLDAVRMACGRRSFAVTDLSDAHVTLAIEGPQTVELLARGCGVDLSDRVFGQDACTRTRFAQLPVLLRRVSHERFELLVDRGVAAYLHDWLLEAATPLVPGARP